MTTSTQRRLSASQRARNDFDAYIASGGDKYPVFEAWQEDYLPEPDYSDFEMPEPSGFDEGAEDGSLDSMIQMWEQ